MTTYTHIAKRQVLLKNCRFAHLLYHLVKDLVDISLECDTFKVNVCVAVNVRMSVFRISRLATAVLQLETLFSSVDKWI